MLTKGTEGEVKKRTTMINYCFCASPVLSSVSRHSNLLMDEAYLDHMIYLGALFQRNANWPDLRQCLLKRPDCPRMGFATVVCIAIRRNNECHYLQLVIYACLLNRF